MKIKYSVVCAAVLASSAFALEPMQKESGWSGQVILAPGAINYKNNEVSGNSMRWLGIFPMR